MENKQPLFIWIQGPFHIKELIPGSLNPGQEHLARDFMSPSKEFTTIVLLNSYLC